MTSLRDFNVKWHGKEVTARIKNNLEEKISKMGNEVKDEAIRSMKHDPKTGRHYHGRSGKTYQASAEGESPAVDTGSLIRSMAVNVESEDDAIVAYIGTMDEGKHDSQYKKGVSLILAKGLSTLKGPRPFLRPALKKLEKNIKKYLEG